MRFVGIVSFPCSGDVVEHDADLISKHSNLSSRQMISKQETTLIVDRNIAYYDTAAEISRKQGIDRYAYYSKL